MAYNMMRSQQASSRGGLAPTVANHSRDMGVEDLYENDIDFAQFQANQEKIMDLNQFSIRRGNPRGNAPQLLGQP